MVGINMDGQARERVLILMAEMDRIEREIREQTSVLEVNNVGMQEPLVDDQGYPRSDIDVYKVRHARHSIICLQNDHKALMKRIEQGLAEVHSQHMPQAASNAAPNTSHTNGHAGNGHAGNGHAGNGHAGNGHATNGHATNGHAISVLARGTEDISVDENNCGFATVSFVHDGSPADLAGLREQDEILQFGSINPQNFRDQSQISSLVANSIGQNIHVLVRRNRQVLSLTVSPRPWAQPGLLGCRMHSRANS